MLTLFSNLCNSLRSKTSYTVSDKHKYDTDDDEGETSRLNLPYEEPGLWDDDLPTNEPGLWDDDLPTEEPILDDLPIEVRP
jgi:hypothetical protein